MTFILNGVSLTISADNYLFTLKNQTDDTVEFGFFVEWSTYSEWMILGDVFMQHTNVIFDRENGRMGFASDATMKTQVRKSIPLLFTTNNNGQASISTLTSINANFTF
eukprot:TRINITY_DN8046_c0_g1_i2.p1 TRINITY_DN8046_c0_g1~~TRINITY_DN8046_c0_g1_i2.p1  ORF type:complete len:108 (+),score=18.02 TRINITY_DN8046_c0_g1_i2:491-814(+)